MEICLGSPLPEGYVITRLNNYGCGTVGQYIESPRNGMEVCLESPIPNGYVVTRTNPNGCGGRIGQYIQLISSGR
ncbi:unnamed protein product [Rotaria magnacalcarata]|uniref:Uncharacterized protein n=1 Tax=Rotaria magnacalcarata TaxID=392030 RepID=A0A820FKK1_9BILA|nr:unnamed protein product [Rotaria magnacalcarata]CAF1656609.1 unnamed protein product [Rotaria magnacalcarata]CAF2067063.1 unnamed protein product [Rotaria magnacalcarata]CAF2106444.1 unnamed protein product [Rotaria magnacalcarata]CAF2153409.1 unnamed protein product [Rotaria magnacalcarata]